MTIKEAYGNFFIFAGNEVLCECVRKQNAEMIVDAFKQLEACKVLIHAEADIYQKGFDAGMKAGIKKVGELLTKEEA